MFSHLRSTPFNINYQIGRACLALCSILTLAFNPDYVLFPVNNGTISLNNDPYNIFLLFENISCGIWVSNIILILVIIGIYPRITSILHVWVTYSITTSVLVIEGGDQIVFQISAYLLPLCLTDNRFNAWFIGKRKKMLSVYLGYLSYSLIIFQMFLIYFFAGMGKIGSIVWQEGTAAYYWFNYPGFGASYIISDILSSLLKNPWLVSSFTWGTIILELLLAILIISLNKKYSKLIFLTSFFFHFLIAGIFGLISFLFAMLGGIILAAQPFKLNLSQHILLKKWKNIKSRTLYMLKSLR